MYSIRSFQPTDAAYEAIALVEKAVYPENADTVEDFKHGDAIREAEQFYQRWVVETDGRIVAFATVKHQIHNSAKGRYSFNITVLPHYERRGMGTAVYDHIWQTIENRTPTPTMLQSGCYQHHPQAIRFLQKRGYQQVMRWVISRLDLPDFDPTTFEPLIAKLEAKEIRFTTLPQLQSNDEAWLDKLYELDWQLTLDEPLPYTPKKLPKEQFRKLFIDNPNIVPDGWFVAVQNGRYLGLSNLEKGTLPGGLSTGFTGVCRDFRRIGLATALKAKAIEYAKNADFSFIRTGNEENNPMLTLNKKLSFTELTASLAFEKLLE